jgi:hypothetical protein
MNITCCRLLFIDRGHKAEELTLLAIREGGEQQLVHHRSTERDVKSREEQRGMEEK